MITWLVEIERRTSDDVENARMLITVGMMMLANSRGNGNILKLYHWR